MPAGQTWSREGTGGGGGNRLLNVQATPGGRGLGEGRVAEGEGGGQVKPLPAASLTHALPTVSHSHWQRGTGDRRRRQKRKRVCREREIRGWSPLSGAVCGGKGQGGGAGAGARPPSSSQHPVEIYTFTQSARWCRAAHVGSLRPTLVSQHFKYSGS